MKKFNTGLEFKGTYKLSNQDSYYDYAVGEVKTGTFTYSGKWQWGRESNIKLTYKLTKSSFTFIDTSDDNSLIGRNSYNRIN